MASWMASEFASDNDDDTAEEAPNQTGYIPFQDISPLEVTVKYNET